MENNQDKMDCNKSKARKGIQTKKIISLLYIIVFLLVLIAPILTINRMSGQKSETENRYLAPFPDVFDQEGHISNNIKADIEAWIADNIGFRSQFTKLAANIKLNLFHQSTSDKVAIGEDGWFFYTQDDNLKIADGTYPLSETLLAEFAEKQQAISDYYKSNGITYVLVLTPSKVSVYPEYLGGSNYQVGVSPADVVERYLIQHTNIHVVNVKPANVQGKETGAQFLKTDTHWTQLGSYTAYCAMIDYFNEHGILSTGPIKATFSETKQIGEFSQMLGGDILPPETVPNAQWDAHADLITSGEWFSQMEQVRQQSGSPYGIICLENKAVGDKTLLIYGDSQWETCRNIPQLLAEHFREVVSFSMNTNPNISMDEVAQPDVVICSCSERYINVIAHRDLTVPKLVQHLPSLPEEPPQIADEWIGTNGICLDTYNGEAIGNKDTFSIHKDAAQVELIGWAADFKDRQPLSALYLQVGERVIQCNYRIERTSVSDHYQNDNLKDTGFSVTFPASYLAEEQVSTLSFIQVGTDGTYRYEPVMYQVSYT